ncbi:MAG TPA: hydroxymethylglutaryl-CoA reductase, degradative [Anaerolineales bacterium]|nr:hydroxymethylglutaryl-CoA reductase, degradative [Anaerolineales bacterium]
MASSRLAGFYGLSLEQRAQELGRAAHLEDGTLDALTGAGGLRPEQADHMIENVVGIYGLPLGIAVNFLINGGDVLIPMVIEEPSVVAGASFMAKIVRAAGGFQAESTAPEMIAQIQILGIPDLEAARLAVEGARERILAEADAVDPVITRLGGGARDLEVRLLSETAVGPMLVVHLVYDTRDAMGANAANTAAERIAPRLEALTAGRAHLRILTNLADRRLARARCSLPAEALAFGSFTGDRVRDGIIEAWAFAEADPYRAATHNKGIMNGVDAVVVATGNDWRAVEAGAHAYAARSGRYTSLSRWSLGPQGTLDGWLEMPMAVGIVGGATRTHPAARAALQLMGVTRASELAEIIVSVGLAQNLAALRALATEGIQRGHMGLHARQVAMAAGAQGDLIETIARKMIDEGKVRPDRAEALLRQARGEASPDG